MAVLTSSYQPSVLIGLIMFTITFLHYIINLAFLHVIQVCECYYGVCAVYYSLSLTLANKINFTLKNEKERKSQRFRVDY